MTEFSYKAAVMDGRLVEGTIEAPRQEDAVAILLTRRLTVMEIAPSRQIGALRRLLTKEIGGSRAKREAARRLLHRLSLLAGASVHIETGLQIIAADSRASRESALGRSLLWRLRDGASLSAAMQSETEAFPIGVAAVVRAGEKGGSLPTTLAKLSERLEKAEAARRSFESALVYPAFLVVTAIAAAVIVLLVVIPQLEPIFQESNVSPPMVTQVAFFLSGWLRRDWAILLGLLAAAFVCGLLALQIDSLRDRLDRVLLKTPALGKTLAHAQTAAFARTLSAMLEGGVALPSALKLCEAAVTNRAFRQSIGDITGKVREGQRFSVVARRGDLPPLFVQLAALGEATGRLAGMLSQCADILDAEVERDLKRFVTFLTPALTFGVGGFVAAIVASVMVVVSSLGEALQ